MSIFEVAFRMRNIGFYDKWYCNTSLMGGRGTTHGWKSGDDWSKTNRIEQKRPLAVSIGNQVWQKQKNGQQNEVFSV